jgi:hypothetical protein
MWLTSILLPLTTWESIWSLFPIAHGLVAQAAATKVPLKEDRKRAVFSSK